MQYIDRLHVSIGIFKDTHFYTVLEQNTQTIFPRGFQLTDTYTHIQGEIAGHWGEKCWKKNFKRNEMEKWNKWTSLSLTQLNYRFEERYWYTHTHCPPDSKNFVYFRTILESRDGERQGKKTRKNIMIVDFVLVLLL